MKSRMLCSLTASLLFDCKRSVALCVPLLRSIRQPFSLDAIELDARQRRASEQPPLCS